MGFVWGAGPFKVTFTVLLSERSLTGLRIFLRHQVLALCCVHVGSKMRTIFGLANSFSRRGIFKELHSMNTLLMAGLAASCEMIIKLLPRQVLSA